MSDRTFDYGITYTTEDIEGKAVSVMENDDGFLIVDADHREYWFRPHDWGYVLDHSWTEFIVVKETKIMKEEDD